MTDSVSTTTVRPPWRDLRWFLAAVIALTIGILLFGLFGPEPPLRVSPETTVITAPLAADGLPDYQAHVLSHYGPRPDPEDNAAVLLLAALWPMEIDSVDRPLVCAAIGIPASPPTDPPPLVEFRNDPLVKPLEEVFERLQTRPWRGNDQPEIRAWLERNAAAIDLLVAASERKTYWLPSPTLLRSKPSGTLIEILLPDIQSMRHASRTLCCRAMWHAGEGRIEAAWRDVVAVRRLCRLLADRPGFLIKHLVAIAMASQAHAATVLLLGQPGLTVEFVQAMRQDMELRQSPETPRYGDTLERLMCVDAAVSMARDRRGRWQLTQALAAPLAAGSLDVPWLDTSLDWNVITSRINEYYAELEAVAALPTHRERVDRMDKLQAALEARARPSSGWQMAGLLVTAAVNRHERSAHGADRLLMLLAPALSSYDAAVARAESQELLLRLAVALEAWRLKEPAAEDRGYPERLDELVPTMLAELPQDPFTEKPFVYERRGDGYLLYGLGQNGVDDGGTDFTGKIVKGEWQETEGSVHWNKSDIVIRMPVPAQK
jgi:hypothetical protein